MISEITTFCIIWEIFSFPHHSFPSLSLFACTLPWIKAKKQLSHFAPYAQGWGPGVESYRGNWFWRSRTNCRTELRCSFCFQTPHFTVYLGQDAQVALGACLISPPGSVGGEEAQWARLSGFYFRIQSPGHCRNVEFKSLQGCGWAWWCPWRIECPGIEGSRVGRTIVP